MAEPLRPHTVIADGAIHNVIALPTGGLAAATSNGVELFDASLAPCGTIRGSGRDELHAVPRDRIATFDRWSGLFVGTVGGELAAIDIGGGMLTSFVVTARGFIAVTSGSAIVDVDGARHMLELAGGRGVRYRDGAAIAGSDGLVIVGADGEVRARADNRYTSDGLTIAGDLVVVPDYETLAVFDGDARQVLSIPQRVGNDSVVGFGNGLVARESNARLVTCWSLAGDEPVEVWTHKSIQMLASPVVCGRFAVLPSYDGPTAIFDADGLVASLPFTGHVRGVVPFGDGIAFAVDDQPAVTWWRRSDVIQLPVDVAARGIAEAGGGVAAFEGRALYVWRTDVQGPEAPAPVACDYPIGVPLIIESRQLTIAAAGRLLIRGVTPAGKTEAVPPGLPWRHPSTRDEAAAVVGRLVKRDFAEVTGSPDSFAGKRPTELVDLHGRGLFAPTTLSAELKQFADDNRRPFLAELSGALGTSWRVLRAAIQARKTKLVPPRPVAGYDYLGTFTTSGTLVVSDPCYLGKSSSKGPGWSLSKTVSAADGLWHVFAANAPGKDGDHTAELAVVHDSGFDVYASEQIATVGVDAGCVGVFDKACPKIDMSMGVDEGVVAGLGAVTHSGYGDGMYPVFAGSFAGKVVKLRVSYISDTPEIDRLVAPVANAKTKAYSASAKFAVGDTIEHVKFGPGSVIRVGSDGKIDVRFADGTRTLVHGRR